MDNQNPTVPMISPDGQSIADIPVASAQQAAKDGYKPSVDMHAPDGSTATIPMSGVHGAMTDGYKLPGGEPAHLSWNQFTQLPGAVAGVARAATNLVKAPGYIYSAVTDAPRNPDEQAVADAANPVGYEGGTVASHGALALKRLVLDPGEDAYDKGLEYEEKATNEKDPRMKAALMDAAGSYKMAAFVPLVGPPAANMAERFEYGSDFENQGIHPDPGGALAEGTTYGAAPGVLDAAKDATVGAIKAAPGAVASAAVRGVGNVAANTASAVGDLAARGVVYAGKGALNAIADMSSDALDSSKTKITEGIKSAINNPTVGDLTEQVKSVLSQAGPAGRAIIDQAGDLSKEVLDRVRTSAGQIPINDIIGKVVDEYYMFKPQVASAIPEAVAASKQFISNSINSAINNPTAEGLQTQIRTILSNAGDTGSAMLGNAADISSEILEKVRDGAGKIPIQDIINSTVDKYSDLKSQAGDLGRASVYVGKSALTFAGEMSSRAVESAKDSISDLIRSALNTPHVDGLQAQVASILDSSGRIGRVLANQAGDLSKDVLDRVKQLGGTVPLKTIVDKVVDEYFMLKNPSVSGGASGAGAIPGDLPANVRGLPGIQQTMDPTTGEDFSGNPTATPEFPGAGDPKPWTVAGKPDAIDPAKANPIFEAAKADDDVARVLTPGQISGGLRRTMEQLSRSVPLTGKMISRGIDTVAADRITDIAHSYAESISKTAPTDPSSPVAGLRVGNMAKNILDVATNKKTGIVDWRAAKYGLDRLNGIDRAALESVPTIGKQFTTLVDAMDNISRNDWERTSKFGLQGMLGPGSAALIGGLVGLRLFGTPGAIAGGILSAAAEEGLARYLMTPDGSTNVNAFWRGASKLGDKPITGWTPEDVKQSNNQAKLILRDIQKASAQRDANPNRPDIGIGPDTHQFSKKAFRDAVPDATPDELNKAIKYMRSKNMNIVE